MRDKYNINNNFNKRELQERINNHEYDRLSSGTKNKLTAKEQLKVNDLVRNPIIIKTDLLKEELTEYALKQSILNNLDYFLRQLGIGFTYIRNEYKLKLSNAYNYTGIGIVESPKYGKVLVQMFIGK